MSSIAPINPLAHGIAGRGVRERPAPVEKPSLPAGSRGVRHSPGTPFVDTTRLVGLSDGPVSAFLDARRAAAVHAARPGVRAIARGGGDAVTASPRVDRVARLEVLGGTTVPSLDEPLGEAVAGSFLVNGVRVEVAATDSLRSLRDRIDSLPAAGGVRATTVASASGGHRLALLNADAESGAIELRDESPDGPLTRLGLIGREVVPNRTPKGDAASARFSSAKVAIASLLGVVTYPPPATIKVNGRTITVDLAVDSLSSIAARVFAEARTASGVEEETIAGSAFYRLVVDGELEPAGPADERVASMVGFVRPERPSLPSLRPRPAGEEPVSDGAAPSGRRPAEAREGRDSGLPGMLARFRAIDAALHRIREQVAPLSTELRALEPEPAGV